MVKSTPEQGSGTEPWTPPAGSWASSAGNRKSMLGNRGRDTTPERALRSLVHASGLRYRVAAKPLKAMRRTADLVFGPTQVAVFVDGCFWHGCPEHFVAPKTNPDFWRQKISRNIQRDRETDARLAEAGWLVLRFWEHEDSEACCRSVVDAVAERRAAQLTGKPSQGRDRSRPDSLEGPTQA
ncbi:very short patch repair endonuclease [Streptomyces sp. NRRL S-87]|uniref:very short patch repair endonuclease n=1 Tax=Streptomyces sp. NRRL S-87 TaxID=1463920 RepID=UPI00099C255C|nr:very short patch repair endonuclease [Streptomyces sp. NRRL S-87]